MPSPSPALRCLLAAVIALGTWAAGAPLRAQTAAETPVSVAPPVPAAPATLAAASLPEIHIARATGDIAIDGNLDDAGWKDAARVDTFWETTPGENVTPKVKTTAWLTYDDHYFYAGFELEDPDPKSIRAPLGDRDSLLPNADYAGIVLDTRHDGKTGLIFYVNAHNVPYDSIANDAIGEDSSLDLYWDSATRITDHGWRLEIRIPFSTLRYSHADPQTWGVQLYRNYPRDFRYQIQSAPIARGSSCFICFERVMTGLSGLPSVAHAVLAPYATARRLDAPGGALGSALDDHTDDWDLGLDAKWLPNADTAIDATINPDFSQVESDVAQIAANERFALFYPERRPFFLEGLDLFSTPIQAVYTRTITSPRWGLRATGELAENLYTILVADDRGGGSVILPGPQTSSFAPQDFGSKALIGRVRHDFGQSFASLLVTDREIDGGGHNRVIGPDMLWRPTDADQVTAQLLYSDSQTPDRPDLSPAWTGENLSSHAAYLDWFHGSRNWDWNINLRDIGDDFRADLGFLPQVGVQQMHLGLGHPFWSGGLIRKVRPFESFLYVRDQHGDLIYQRLFFGVEWGGAWNTFFEIHPLLERTRIGTRILDSNKMTAHLEMNPPRFFEQLGFDIRLGDEIDLAAVVPGHGGYADLHGTLRTGDHVQTVLNYNRRWSDRSEGPRRGDRAFTAEVDRIKTTYTFTARSFLRLIGQRELFESDPSLYSFPQPKRSDTFSGSALFAYKLNWQTVLFVGYGDDRVFSEVTDRLEPASRQLFFKISYAFQR
jgi:hypothetical protein